MKTAALCLKLCEFLGTGLVPQVQRPLKSNEVHCVIFFVTHYDILLYIIILALTTYYYVFYYYTVIINYYTLLYRLLLHISDIIIKASESSLHVFT